MRADPVVLRMIDANANRAREALRVMEDYARFGLNDGVVCGEVKAIRHALAEALGRGALAGAILARDTPADVGATIKTAAELTRESVAGVVIAASKRLSEALRVLEECAKAVPEGGPEAARAIEPLRYRGYAVEQVLSRFAGGGSMRARFGEVRLHVLLTEALCEPAAGGWEKTLEALLHGAGPAESGRLCVQLREKHLEDGELLRRARAVAARCRGTGALSVINDRADIALLAGADGVHLGQDDLPCAAVRKLAGQPLGIGVSTENLEQARRAAVDGATYVAVGPMFPTTTKEKPRLAGPAYARAAVREMPADMAIVAIGGITVENVPQLTSAGVRTVAVCHSVIGQADPAGAVRRLLSLLQA